MSTHLMPQSLHGTALAALRSYAIRSLQSNTGKIEADHVCCIPSVHPAGHCIFGGDYLIRESGIYLVDFLLEITDFDVSLDPLVILDVYDNLQSKLVVAERSIDRADLAGTPLFSLKFHGRIGQRVEFRAYWRGKSKLKLYGIILKQRSASGEIILTACSIGSRRVVESVTAIIPCFNGAPWLSEAITSIHTQTRAVDEIIVVDDCSSDGS